MMTTSEEQQKLVQAVCRRYRSIPWKPLLEKQRDSPPDAPARGNVWISRTFFQAPPEPALKDALFRVIYRLRREEHVVTDPRSIALQDVGVEFIGQRRDGGRDEGEPVIPEATKLKKLESECQSEMTILYIHGGGLYFSSPIEYRAASTRLARMTKARVASIRYRLAPANSFPAPVLDTLLAYASLIYPPPDATYSATPADRIILAGNSAGANLCFALTKFLLELGKLSSESKMDLKLQFHGRPVSLPLPGGIATMSGWCDQCDALPSWHAKGANDILGVLQPALMPTHPTDEIWPSTPPREHPYCAAATLDHELVTPAAVLDWTGAPPMWFACGSEERGIDGNKVVASQAAKSGVVVSWNEYQGMPHEFPIIIGSLPQAQHAFNLWASACTSLMNGTLKISNARQFLMPDCKERSLGSPDNLSPLPFEEIRTKMKEYNRTRPVWNGKVAQTKL